MDIGSLHSYADETGNPQMKLETHIERKALEAAQEETMFLPMWMNSLCLCELELSVRVPRDPKFTQSSTL